MKRYLLASIAGSIMMVSACGFTPLHGNYSSTAQSKGAVSQHFERTFIQAIPDRDGQFLYNQLVERINASGYAQNPAYALTVAPITSSQRDLDITEDDNTTRTQLTLRTTMMLKSTETGKKLLQRDMRSVTSYNVLSGEFATRVSRQSARESALKDLAKQIETQLALYYAR